MEKMAEFVAESNLPKDADIIIIGEQYLSHLREPLEKQGIEVLPVAKNNRVDPRLSSHADITVFHAGNRVLFVAECLKESEFVAKLKEIGCNINFCTLNQAENYPFDAGLNVCCVGEHFIYNPKVNDEAIITHLKEQGRVPVACRQGYCKCSVCVVDEKSIICADKGICTAAKAAGIDVLEIQPGYIELEGFDYGFIGGASFKISSDKLAFTGLLDRHPDKEKILDFLEECGIMPVFLTEQPVFDIGSAIILTEKEPKT